MDENPIVFIVDDDQAIREGIADLVEGMGLEYRAFASAEEFLDSDELSRPGCLVLDVRMPKMSGIELLRRLQEAGTAIPTILVTGHGDIPMAVEALKIGAVDFVEKPFREQALWDSIHKALETGTEHRAFQAGQVQLKKKLALLTPKELDVLKLLISGQSDKQIAQTLETSRRTVAYHRATILEKTAATTVIELAADIARFHISI